MCELLEVLGWGDQKDLQCCNDDLQQLIRLVFECLAQ